MVSECVFTFILRIGSSLIFYMDMIGQYILKREEKYVDREKADGEKRQERNL